MQMSFGKPNDLRKYSVTAGGDWGGGLVVFIKARPSNERGVCQAPLTIR